MALTNTEYDRIMREYEIRREESRHNAQEALRTVREKIPQYRETERRITDIAMDCADKVFEGDTEAVNRMRSEIDAITAMQKKLLEDNGFAPDFLEEKHVCPDCKDTGYIDGNKCHCFRQAILRYLYRQSNMEEVLQRENFDTLRYDLYTDAECEKMKTVISQCRQFAEEFGNNYSNILLYGNVGVGKTFLTNCMAKEILDKGYSVIYFTSMRLFDTLSRELLSRNDEISSRDILNDVFTCDLLIIDDLGTEIVNSFVASRLFDILNERDLRKRSTIISTNLSFEELGKRYTERNFSRIFGNYLILHPDVEDIRIRRRRQ